MNYFPETLNTCALYFSYQPSELNIIMDTLQNEETDSKSAFPKWQFVGESTRNQTLNSDSKDCILIPCILLFSSCLV